MKKSKKTYTAYGYGVVENEYFSIGALLEDIGFDMSVEVFERVEKSIGEYKLSATVEKVNKPKKKGKK